MLSCSVVLVLNERNRTVTSVSVTGLPEPVEKETPIELRAEGKATSKLKAPPVGLTSRLLKTTVALACDAARNVKSENSEVALASHPPCGLRRNANDRCGSLCKALHSDPYAQVATMCSYAILADG